MPEVRPALVELTIARLKEFIRETEAIFWVFGFPLLLTLALGFAFREKPPDRIPVGIAAGPNAQARLAALQKSPVLLPRILNEAAAREELRRGKISLLVEEGAQPVYRFDATRPESRSARSEVDDALQSASGRKNVFAAKELHVAEQGSRYVDFLVPGLLGMNLMGTGMWGVGFSVVNARLKKLLKRLVATPMRKSDYLIAQFVSRLVFLVIEVGVVLLFAWLVFDVRVRGSLALFALISIVGGVSFACVGLLVASRARTVEAVSGMMNLTMMPMWLCSGVFFSYERFPDAAKPFIRALPLTALNDALRGVMNDGLSIVQVAPQLANLLIWGVVSYAIALKIFRWQ
ncbi:MAG TPA: ABC transporter permease [Thermoanaerobaculia bacterium]|nr:ABC transporter permease [Thermoanaerobaculia bacterium]